MKAKVPYYAQTSEFTCGPACILMVTGCFETCLKLNRSREFEAWRQCNMIGVRGADPYGLCVPLLDAGYEVLLSTRRRRMLDPIIWKERPREHAFTPEEMRLTFFGVAENRKRAIKRGLPVEYGPPMVEAIAERIHEGYLPIALVHMGVVHDFNTAHWVVVTAVDAGGGVTFHDPYPPKGGRGIHLPSSSFQKILDDIGTQIGMSPSVVFVRPRPCLASGLS